jgi:hypothetical protein
MRYLVTLAVAVAVVSCVHTKAALLDPSLKLDPICPEGVVIFTDSSKVGRPYREVALLASEGDNSTTSSTGMINSQRKKAAELGANGVILGNQKDASTSAQVFHALIGTSANRKGGALAIYIPSDSTRVADACKAAAEAQRSH